MNKTTCTESQSRGIPSQSTRQARIPRLALVGTIMSILAAAPAAHADQLWDITIAYSKTNQNPVAGVDATESFLAISGDLTTLNGKQGYQLLSVVGSFGAWGGPNDLVTLDTSRGEDNFLVLSGGSLNADVQTGFNTGGLGLTTPSGTWSFFGGNAPTYGIPFNPNGTNNASVVGPFGGGYYANSTIAAVPEPGTCALTLAGLLSIGAVARRRSMIFA